MSSTHRLWDKNQQATFPASSVSLLTDEKEAVLTLNPRIVVAGHKDPSTRDDDPQSILDATRKYILDFDKAVTECATPQDLIEKMMQLHGERGNPQSLWDSAFGVKDQLGRSANATA